MRVLYTVQNHYWEDANLLAGLRQAGHDVVVHRPGHPFHEALSPQWTPADRERVSDEIVTAVRREHARRPVDVFFGYLLDQLIFPEAVREIGEMGITTLNYWCNGAHQFHLVAEISPAFDRCVVTEREALPSYEAVGARPVYLQLAANPEVYRPHDLPMEYDVTFVGQRYADRPEYLAYLLANDVDVRVWGPGWTPDRTFGEQAIPLGLEPRTIMRHPRSSLQRIVGATRKKVGDLVAVPPHAERRLRRAAGPSLSYDELIRMYSRSRISLGFSTCGDARYGDREKIRQIHLRDFEATMSGALYLVEYQEELEDFFEVDREIICYRSREELLEKIRYYLARPEEALRVRRAGYERAQRDHTWKQRFEALFRAVQPRSLA